MGNLRGPGGGQSPGSLHPAGEAQKAKGERAVTLLARCLFSQWESEQGVGKNWMCSKLIKEFIGVRTLSWLQERAHMRHPYLQRDQRTLSLTLCRMTHPCGPPGGKNRFGEAHGSPNRN